MLKLIIPMLIIPSLKFNYKSFFLLSSLSISLFIASFPYSASLFSSKLFFYDQLSFSLILLSFMSFILIMLSSFSPFIAFPYISFINLALFLSFSAQNTIFFYIFFESVLIPTLLIITSEGKAPERLQAGVYIFIYTIFGSLPLLLGLLWNFDFSSFPFLSITTPNFSFPIIFILAFLIKLPMFLFHLWLPKAHVEAPLEGSMILAAVLLKLGGYGMIRMLPMVSFNFLYFKHTLISISLIGAILTSLNCLRQKDLKSLIAYSSVAHMGFTIAAISSFKSIGISAAILMMVAHGLSSSSLFFLVTILYNFSHSRNILIFKSLITFLPNLTLWFFIFLAVNFSAPPSFNMVSETMIISSLSHLDFLNMLPIFLAAMFTASFSIIFYANISHNHPFPTPPSSQSTDKIFLSLYSHFFPVIIITMKPEILNFAPSF